MRYDIIIIGGGSAGSVLAARLSEDPTRTVLVIDAGKPFAGIEPADRLDNVTFALTTRDWGIRATLAAGRQLDYPQGRAFGGGSSVNAALALRGEPDDYENWIPGDRRWSWETMLPCFRGLETDSDFTGTGHGTDGPIPIERWKHDELVPIQRAFEAGSLSVGFDAAVDHNAPAVSGIGPLPMNRRDGIRVSTAIAYLAPALSRPNLTMLGDAHVLRVEVRDGRAIGASVRFEGRTELIEAGEVIVSSGAINTPALLMRSGIGPAEDLAGLDIDVVADLPGVGQNLMDHPGVFVLLHPRTGVVDMAQTQFQLGSRFSSTGGTKTNDLLMGFMNFWDLTASPDFQAMIGAPMVSALTIGLHAPSSRGRVTLTSADPAVLPDVDLNMLSDPSDVALLIEGLRRCRDVAQSDAMGEVVSSMALLESSAFDDDEALDSYVRSMVAPWYHPSGTCRIGSPDDDLAVVGADLRVRGIEGLRIVDASVLPVIPRAPTNLTVIAVAERAAQLISV